ncbi:uncharacterized protein LOC130701683 [Daphnia carinata]|uniref:uncharacterized protein LOC130701683 n=1 Tax=Daphnia carinata TaxID=120202 RepID=UPI00257FDC04|nr:uncharacterized protein LOC130701683 [Daphnia carinata]XP_059350242.1 uncharacterized protein LOC130701683 [Daphnia carinata]
MASSSGDVQSHHRHQFSKTSTTMTSTSNNSLQHSAVAIDEQNSTLEHHHPVYPVSEWDTKLDRMLDELQRSISPQRKTEASRIEVGRHETPVSVTSVHRQSSSKATSTSGTNQHLAEQAVSQTSIARRLFDTASDSAANSSSVRVARSRSPELLPPVEGRPHTYTDGPFGKALSASGSIGRARSSSQQREYREYHTSTKNHGDGSLLVGMPASEDDAHQATPPSVSDRAKAWSSRGVTYSFKEEVTSSTSSKNAATAGAENTAGVVETTVKRSQVVKSSTNGQQNKKTTPAADQVDSSLNNVVVDIGNQMIPDCIDLLASNKKEKTKKSVRLAEGNQSSTQQVTGSSSQFYSYNSSSSSSSSSKKQVVASSSTSGSTMVGDSTVDYSRISKKQIGAATGAMNQKQLDSPVCNFTDHDDFPKYNVRVIPESAGLLCNVASHPHPMCNIERHPHFPLYAASPPCPPGSQDTQPVCNIEAHPAILCNYPHHPDYPGFAAGCPPSETICNVPSHPELLCNLPKHADYPKHASRCPPPEIEPICNMDLPKGHPRVVCNFVRHPHYPKYCNAKLTGQQPNSVCNVPAHRLDKCNIPEHPDFPDFKANKPPVAVEGNMNTPTPNDDVPLCTVPGHPMLICNVTQHPDYPKFTHPELPEFSEAVAGLVCTIPSHPHDPIPLPSKCNIPGHPGYPDFMSLAEPQTEPFCDVPGHPFGLCNIQTHPQYPELMDPVDRDAAPYCFIPSHPELLCNIAHHPDFPGYTTEGEVPSEPICNVPRHPPIPIVEIQVPSPTPSPLTARSPSPPVRDSGPVICNIPFHPQYPALMGDSSPLSLPVCSVPGHPPLLCNVPKHPNFPEHVGHIGLKSPPQCNIPGHPQLLCNLPHHPDYPRLAGDCPSEPYCNLPTHPLTNKPKLYQAGTGSPLPNRRQGTPDPGLQAPPKKLDDLMATFNGGPPLPLTSTPRGDPQKIVFSPSPAVQLPLKSKEPVDGETEPLIEKEAPKRPTTKGTSGPPVYYPPDHKMFTKKDVPIVSRTLEKKSKTMGGRSKGKMKFAAKHSAKASESDSSAKGAYGGAAVIPICLPVCCAMPCVIM